MHVQTLFLLNARLTRKTVDCGLLMSKPPTRKERRHQRRERYLAGEARHPYLHTPSLRESPSSSGASTSTTGPTVCGKCRPILSLYANTFKSLVHQGSDLKIRKTINPHPKKPSAVHYRDLNRQNDWLRENVFDPMGMGNYLYCSDCICASLQMSKQRLARQRHIKRQQSQQPLVEMTKTAVERENLVEYVVMPTDLDIPFMQWWRFLESAVLVNVRYPHQRHGNAGKPSHFAKTSVKEDFLAFVDANSQPNGRSADSSGPTLFYLQILNDSGAKAWCF